jgi:chromate transporter
VAERREVNASEQHKPPVPAAPRGTWREVLLVFLRLGLTSFGGPIAHLGYVREEFVARRHWLDDRSYADLVALCQFLPGPASSQVGIALGLSRAGYGGALAAWLGFTMPSAIALILFAYGVGVLGQAAGSGWLHGLMVAAVAVVAQAVLSMMRTLTTDRERATIAVAAAVLLLTSPRPGRKSWSLRSAGLWEGSCYRPSRRPITQGCRFV